MSESLVVVGDDGRPVLTILHSGELERAKSVAARFRPQHQSQWDRLMTWLHEGVCVGRRGGWKVLERLMDGSDPDAMRNFCTSYVRPAEEIVGSEVGTSPTPMHIGELGLIYVPNPGAKGSPLDVDTVDVFNRPLPRGSGTVIRTHNSTVMFWGVQTKEGIHNVVVKLSSFHDGVDFEVTVEKSILSIPDPLNEAMVSMQVSLLTTSGRSPYFVRTLGGRVVSINIGDDHMEVGDKAEDRKERKAVVVAVEMCSGAKTLHSCVHRRINRIEFAGRPIDQTLADVKSLAMNMRVLRHVIMALHVLQLDLGLVHNDLHGPNVMIVRDPTTECHHFRASDSEVMLRLPTLTGSELGIGRDEKWGVRVIDFASSSTSALCELGHSTAKRSVASDWGDGIYSRFLPDFDISMLIMTLSDIAMSTEWAVGTLLSGRLLRTMALHGSRSIVQPDHILEMLLPEQTCRSLKRKPGVSSLWDDANAYLYLLFGLYRCRVTLRSSHIQAMLTPSEPAKETNVERNVRNTLMGRLINIRSRPFDARRDKTAIISLAGYAMCLRWCDSDLERKGMKPRNEQHLGRNMAIRLAATRLARTQPAPGEELMLVADGKYTTRSLINDKRIFPAGMWVPADDSIPTFPM